MSTDKTPKTEDLPDSAFRLPMCLPRRDSNILILDGQGSFREETRQHPPAPEIKVGSELSELKARLRMANIDEFWQMLVEGMTKIAGSQIAFVSKRVPRDDGDYISDKLPLGERVAMYVALAYYYDDGYGKSESISNTKYETVDGSPCDYMKHNKVLIIPERFGEVITATDYQPPFPIEAYLSVPLFSEGTCFGFFGMMWSPEGARNRKLPWSTLELVMYTLEDLVSSKMLLPGGNLPPTTPGLKLSDAYFPPEAATPSLSLKPYASSLSHELRTPMQGVVGMLDVIHATVQEEVEGQSDSLIREVFRSLKENIEIVQDSSRRAVEAADNVVHAYDLNMQVPETPKQPTNGAEGGHEQQKYIPNTRTSKGKRPNIIVEGHDLCIERPIKRRRSGNPNGNYYSERTKHRATESPDSLMSEPMSPQSQSLTLAVQECEETVSETNGAFNDIDTTLQSNESEGNTPTGVGHSRLRELLHLIIKESLGVGERPDSAIAVDTDFGERIEVRSKDSRGDTKIKTIELSVDPAVPETLQVDERDLTKLISCVFLNAVKFTECGKIAVTARLNLSPRYIVVTVTDTGPGIPQTFLPYLFRPFSREDGSLTRQKDGLGLGLLVAKGLARKIGGDLKCISSDTSGPNRGSVFEIRLPIVPMDGSPSGPSTPIRRTPTPSPRSGGSPDVEGYPFLSETPRSVPRQDFTSFQNTPNHLRHRLSLPTAVGSLSISPPLTSERLQRPPTSSSRSRQATTSPQQSTKRIDFNRKLAETHPITFLVAEDNRINRRLLVNMLGKMGYNDVYEAFDGADAVRQMKIEREKAIDVVLMDLWMPEMDGYEAAQRILSMPKYTRDDGSKSVTILAVTADVTSEALEHAAQVGMEGFMTKPYKLLDLERLILEFCAHRNNGDRET